MRPVLAQLIIASLAVLQGYIGAILDRPLTWDKLGIVPIESIQKPTPEQVRLFELMRQGEYFQASAAAKAHFLKDSKDLVDVWIIAEAARKRGTADELVAECEEIVIRHPTTAAKLLLLKALNLSERRPLKLRGSGGDRVAWINAIEKRIHLCEAELRPEAAKNLAVLAVVNTSIENDIFKSRESAKAFHEATPKSVEAWILYVRSLLSGEWGTELAHADSSGKLIPNPPQQRFTVRPGYGPRTDEALRELDALEKQLGRCPLVDYYRAMAYAMKAYFADRKTDDESALRRQAIANAQLFLTHCADYPRLESCARRYLTRPTGFGSFFPWYDE